MLRSWFGFGGACRDCQLTDNFTPPFTDLLKNKSRPENAAEGAAAWVITERELREKLKKEREAKERELEKEVRGLPDHIAVYLLTRITGEGARGGGETSSGGREGEGQNG